ncbi:hypothetical protein Fmac_014005 [Flemingia macrophylla]|uniref:Ribosomal protein S19 n=1 Tax=Flemingia macrophylla TaxID=520843 RepID=A0ABD1MAX5_9FABA
MLSRKIEMWDQRSVFGYRARNLKGLMLGENAPPTLEFGNKRLRSIKFLKRTSHSIKSEVKQKK